MIKKILNAIWNFLVAVGEYRQNQHKYHGYRQWY
jgi:hypothetical protein